MEFGFDHGSFYAPPRFSRLVLRSLTEAVQVCDVRGSKGFVVDRILDAETLKTLKEVDRGGSLNLALDLIRLFEKDAPLQIQEIEDGLKASDRERVRKAAHRLKSSCRTLGAESVAILCYQIEASSNVETQSEIFKILRRDLNAALNEIQSKKENLLKSVQPRRLS